MARVEAQQVKLFLRIPAFPMGVTNTNLIYTASAASCC